MCQVIQTRRDDLCSLFFVLIFLLKGSLPWQDYEYSEKVRLAKMKYGIDLVGDLPEELKEFRRVIFSILNYDDLPDYDYLYQLLYWCFVTNNFTDDGVCDWETDKEAVTRLQILSSHYRPDRPVTLRYKSLAPFFLHAIAAPRLRTIPVVPHKPHLALITLK